jgi:excisionase family DNA binding protein
MTTLEPLAVSPKEAWHLLGCGNSRGYDLLAAGELESYVDGRNRRITMRSIKSYIERRLAEAVPVAKMPPQRASKAS